MEAPVSGVLELAVHEPPDDEAQSRLIGVRSPTMTGNAMNRILASSLSAKDARGMLRTCDFDTAGGPLELEKADWDGLSVWIGAIPSHGVCCRDGASDGDASRTAASARAGTGIFHRMYKLTDSLEQELNAVGAGIEPDDAALRTVCVRDSDSWALVTFKRREDAEMMLKQGLSITSGSDDARAPLLLKRAICASEARQQLQEAAQADKEKYEMVLLAVSRIQSWVKRSGMRLVDLFTTIDTDGSGDFNVQEFRAGMLSIGLTFTDEVIDALMQQMDKDGDGEVDVTEFISKMDKLAHELDESASSILGALARYMDASGATVASIFAANDKDQSGHLNVTEFHDALLAIGIQQSERSAREALKELDMDGDGNMALTELTAHLSEHRRKRRTFAAKVLSEIFDFIDKTNASATRIFARVDSDGSGDLDVLEFQEALSRMGQELTPDQVPCSAPYHSLVFGSLH
jgi:calmodulin